jgi:hypothetical protein
LAAVKASLDQAWRELLWWLVAASVYVRDRSDQGDELAGVLARGLWGSGIIQVIA